MADSGQWTDLGSITELRAAGERRSLRQIAVGRTLVALSYRDGEFGAISGHCNHAGGPLGEGHLDGEYVVCPWHHWKFHGRSGEGEPGFEADRVPSYELKEEGGRLWLRLPAATPRQHLPHPRIRSPANRSARRVPCAWRASPPR